MAKESNTAFPEDELQWHLWFIPNYNENESLIIMKAHHIMADGMGWILTLGSLQETYDPKQFIQTTQVLSKCRKLTLALLKPITMTYSFVYFLFWKTDVNVIKQTTNLNSFKKNAITKAFNVTALKSVAKQYGGTLNDVVLSILSLSLKEYMEGKGEKSAKTFNLLVPFSLRELPQKQEELVF
jgi:NRPS condensation-like uncharacterized protein